MKKSIISSETIKTKIKNHIKENIKEYAVVTLIFFIGIIVGIIFINNSSVEQETEISKYINNFVTSIKQNSEVNFIGLLKQSVSSNILLTLCLWFAGCTVVGMPIVYGTVAFRGFCFGYTISALIAIFGKTNGLIFGISSILIQSIVLIPAIFALSVSGIKLYKSIMKDKRRENIKLEILRHTAFSASMCIAMIFASFLETYISTNIFINIIQIIG